MNFRSFLKDKLNYILSIFFIVITSEILLLPFKVARYVRFYIGIISLLLLSICIWMEYYKKNKYYQTLKGQMKKLEEKYLISELINDSNFEEGKILKEILQEVGTSMLENVNKYKHLQEDYKEYIELWIHEVKMPIATSKMIIENNKTQVTESINEELDKIDNHIEQALFYARSSMVEKDYYIKKSALKEIVNVAILKNRRSLIQNKMNLNLHDLEKIVYTDSKWSIFILNQIIQNAIKYSKDENKSIEICAIEQKEKIILSIKDNGIGISESEIGRVFEKGFTGTNGRRKGQKSTGIGLYLCKKLCDKLGLGLELNSEEERETEVKIIFPKSSFVNEVL